VRRIYRKKLIKTSRIALQSEWAEWKPTDLVESLKPDRMNQRLWDRGLHIFRKKSVQVCPIVP
jgi:hypothetical protein